VPVRTFDDGDDPPPRFVEADLVVHSGPVARGSFAPSHRGPGRCRPSLVAAFPRCGLRDA
jgi:hypothetical protein